MPDTISPCIMHAGDLLRMVQMYRQGYIYLIVSIYMGGAVGKQTSGLWPLGICTMNQSAKVIYDK